MTHHSHREAQGTGDWIMGAVKSNPEGLLLLAAGCALLLRSGASGRSAQAHERSGSTGTGRERTNEYYGPRQTGAGISETISQAADSARDYAADVSKTVSDKAGTYASAVGEYADDAWRQSERFVGQARNTVQNTINRVLQEQPLALAVVGLAAGAAVAAVFPATAVERRTLGPAGERLTDAAASAGQQLSKQPPRRERGLWTPPTSAGSTLKVSRKSRVTSPELLAAPSLARKAAAASQPLVAAAQHSRRQAGPLSKARHVPRTRVSGRQAATNPKNGAVPASSNDGKRQSTA